MAKAKTKKRKSAPKKKAAASIPLVPILVGVGILYLMFAPQTTYANTNNNGGGGGGNNNGGGGGYIPIGPPPAGGNGFTPMTGSPGSADESYLGLPATSTPRGIRNNNPGNEKRGASNWQGKVPFPQSTDNVFEQFYRYRDGVRVMIYELKNNYINDGFNTIDKILRRYDPPGNTGYINYVSGKTGLGIHTVLTADKPTLKKLVQAMTRFENDRKLVTQPEVVTDAQFEAAWAIL